MGKDLFLVSLKFKTLHGGWSKNMFWCLQWLWDKNMHYCTHYNFVCTAGHGCYSYIWSWLRSNSLASKVVIATKDIPAIRNLRRSLGDWQEITFETFLVEIADHRVNDSAFSVNFFIFMFNFSMFVVFRASVIASIYFSLFLGSGLSRYHTDIESRYSTAKISWKLDLK